MTGLTSPPRRVIKKLWGCFYKVSTPASAALRRGDVAPRSLVPGYRPQLATRGDRARAVAAAMVTWQQG